MTLSAAFEPTLPTLGALTAAMALIALIEVALPLQAGGRWRRAHLRTNFFLTLLTLATNSLWNAALVTALLWLESSQMGLLYWLAPPRWASALVVVLALDLSFYLSHVLTHKIPSLWRFHRVHHSDPFVDVTTALRQHPVEGLTRYVFLVAFALPLGVSPWAFAIYRATSALSGLLEHANMRLPAWLDTTLSLIFTWPNVHKVHHSRDVRFTDTNYGNLFSWWDRLFGTFTPASHGATIDYGLDGYDDPATQTASALLAFPSGDGKASGAAPAAEPAP